MVVLSCLLFWVARSKESQILYQAVVEPLVPDLGEECVTKVISVVCVNGGAMTNTNRGSNTPQKMRQNRDFDPTKGYPGEDISDL